MLKQQIESETQKVVTLQEQHRHRSAYSFDTASTRGYSIVASLVDEIAYWPIDENACEPDVEVLNAIKPGMANVPGAMLLCASSPHSRRGALYEAWQQALRQGRRSGAGVASRHTRDMNPSVPQIFHRQPHGQRSSACCRRIPRAIQNRP